MYIEILFVIHLFSAYEPLKLMQTVMAKINEVCLRYLDNSMLCSLPTSDNAYFATSVCAVRNSRKRMEDRHVYIHDLNTMFNNQVSTIIFHFGYLSASTFYLWALYKEKKLALVFYSMVSKFRKQWCEKICLICKHFQWINPFW